MRHHFASGADQTPVGVGLATERVEHHVGGCAEREGVVQRFARLVDGRGGRAVQGEGLGDIHHLLEVEPEIDWRGLRDATVYHQQILAGSAERDGACVAIGPVGSALWTPIRIDQAPLCVVVAR